MKSMSNFVFVFSTILQIADSLSIQPRAHVAQARVVGLPIHRSEIQDPVAHDKRRMQRRNAPVTGELDNLQTLYFLNTTLGTPPQSVRLHVDTGSSDMWVNTPSSRLCSLSQQPCSYSQTYTANKSSTYEYVGSYFNISYVDNSGAAGDYATDIMRFSGQNISSFQFGIGYDSASAQNVLGIGYPNNEVQVVRAGKQSYHNLPAKMQADGMIPSTAFSLWLNDVDANTGNILFGGVDTSKFEGSLVSVPIQKVNNAYSQFFVTMTGLKVGSTTAASDTALGVLLDTGSSLTYLPNNITTKIYSLVNAVYQDAEGAAFIPCSMRNKNTSLTFQFSSPASITVSLAEMILDLRDLTGKKVTFDNNVEACLFGIAPAGDSTSVLGDTFLRSAYVVYDMDNNEISLANAKTNVTTSNVIEITSGSNGVPSATKASNPVTATTGLPGASGGSNKKTSQSDSAAAGVAPSIEVLLLVVAAVGAAFMFG
ncbi:hypothetical protein QQS21_009775 [Conoideocrella luteorostrata]|uniref:Probable aspartic-type endopeptidase OPSB n=1 Tax=Conoideocrella luteorostrata TaxID=1105319 RepID=A0AAJ0FXH8_9HYPO|nr:hypothetical protein QQS21_009775 [Conoideocrella luteorostrata]